MKNLKTPLVLVLGFAILVVVGVMSYQAMVVSPRAAEQRSVLKQYNFPGSAGEVARPSNSFPVGDSGENEINGMLQILDESSDDGGLSDIESLTADTEGL